MDKKPFLSKFVYKTKEMITEITSLDQPGIDVYGTLTEAQLRNKLEPEKGVFIAESPKVINVAFDAGYEPVSLLCEQRHIEGDAKELIARKPDMPVYTGSRELLAKLTGYTLTRGVLCAMHRPMPRSVEEILNVQSVDKSDKTDSTTLYKSARRIVVLDGIVDSTNIGAIFRSAAALGIDAVLLTRTSCDPFNRRAVRVSMGSVFLVPWTWLDEPLESLHKYGFKTVAMALRNDSVMLDDPRLKGEEKLAIVMGNEGDGLPSSTIAAADYVVKIPMMHNVDSLNVAAASAVAFWELTK